MILPPVVVVDSCSFMVVLLRGSGRFQHRSCTRPDRGPPTRLPRCATNRTSSDEERDLRHVAVGRKNWLVFASERGGEVVCRLYSLVLSCKQAGVDPEVYIEDVLGRLPTTPAADIATLTPWAWAAARK